MPLVLGGDPLLPPREGTESENHQHSNYIKKRSEKRFVSFVFVVPSPCATTVNVNWLDDWPWGLVALTVQVSACTTAAGSTPSSFSVRAYSGP